MDNKTIKSLLKDKAGQDFIKFINQKINELNNLDGIMGSLPEEIALETESRKKAILILKEILDPFINLEEDRDIDKPEVY